LCLLSVDCPQCGDDEAKELVQFRVCPKISGFAGDKLGIGRCVGGPGGPLILRSLKLKKRASDPVVPKMGFPKIAPRNFFWIWVTCPWAQNGGCQKNSPCGPLRGQLPIV